MLERIGVIEKKGSGLDMRYCDSFLYVKNGGLTQFFFLGPVRISWINVDHGGGPRKSYLV